MYTRARSALALAAAMALLGCAAPPPPSVPGPSRGAGAECVALFRHFDYLERTLSIPWRERWTVAPEFMRSADRLRQADCFTLTTDLSLDAPAPDRPAAMPTAIQPIALHAGVVTNMADDAAARARFEAGGVRARSVGHPALGRRIYLGPFASEEALVHARDLAISAGFDYPYPARF